MENGVDEHEQIRTAVNLPISVSAREPWQTDYGTQSLPETERGDLNFRLSFFKIDHNYFDPSFGTHQTHQEAWREK